VLGCCEPAEPEDYQSLQLCQNRADGSDTLHDSSSPVVCDSQLSDNSKMQTVSPALRSATEALYSSVTEELCLYTCDVCNLQFSTGVSLRRHRRCHKGCAACTHCGHSFHSAAALRHHVMMQCSRKVVTCNICRESLGGWPSLSRHTTVTHPSADACPLCGHAFLQVEQLLIHRSVHTTKIYQCRTCSQRFRSRRRMKRHVWNHITNSEDGTLSENYRKEISGNEHSCESQVNQDSVNISVSESWLMDINGDGCLSGCSLNEIDKGINISCQQKKLTGASLASKSSVKENKASRLAPACSLAHRLLPMPSPCYSLAASVSTSNRYVDGHRLILCFDKQPPPNNVSVTNPPEGDAAVKEISDERVVCAECSRTFKRLSDLHVHMQCHTGVMRYKCSVCTRPFRKSGTLARHMRIHTGERPYVCETCGKSYKLLFHLRLHTSVHSSDRPFSCEVCGKAFQSAASLKKHRFVHTGVKPFSCPICMRLFNRRSNMHAHMRVHDGARQHEVFGQEQICILCRKKFGNVASLQAHLQTHARQLELDVGETITADDSADSSSKEMIYCKMEKQQTEDVYVALPLVHFDDLDVG